MDKNLWININRALIFIRSDIKNIAAYELINLIEGAIMDKLNNEIFVSICMNSNIKFIQNMAKENSTMYISFIQGDSEIEIKDDKAIGIVFSTIKLIKIFLMEKDFVSAYYLVDAVHFLPELIANQSNINYEEIWNTMFVPNLKSMDKSIFYNLKINFDMIEITDCQKL